MTKLKICGLTRPEDIAVANRLQLDYIGFVFAKSRRKVMPEQAETLKLQLNPNILAVGVFVNAPIDTMAQLVEDEIIDLIQLHGQEGEQVITALKNRLPDTKIIKAISVKTAQDVEKWQDSQADYLLLDNGAGGTGASFDWDILSELSTVKKPYFIAGGLTPCNVSQVLDVHPYGVDVSGGVETDGLKDPMKMLQFLKNVRNMP
ncbi:MAG: phosphoribosylanthranilate isomerase [Eubacteriales bacterium]